MISYIGTPHKVMVGDLYWYRVSDDYLPVEVLGVKGEKAEVMIVTGRTTFWVEKIDLLLKRHC
jgi:hypothetical protein